MRVRDRRARLRCSALLAPAILLVAALAACAPPTPSPVAPTHAFYLWRTRLALSAPERDALTALRVGRLFVRFFDVTWDTDAGAATPVGILDVERASLPGGLEVVPVVFLRAEVLAHTPRSALPTLAARVWRQAGAVASAGGLAFRELQFDCDWTDATREPYFALLREFGALARPAGVSLSTTIRLHQVKYRERTGVPPVERGMLMFYNMGRITADPADRAIFDAAAAGRYTARLRDYPLPLDVALPIWSWTIHARGDSVVGLLQSTDPDELAGVGWLAPAGPGRLVATRSAFLHGVLVREGDFLKAERIGPAEAAEAARLAADALGPSTVGGPRSVALFDLSERTLARHDQASLDRLFHLFR